MVSLPIWVYESTQQCLEVEYPSVWCKLCEGEWGFKTVSFGQKCRMNQSPSQSLPWVMPKSFAEIMKWDAISFVWKFFWVCKFGDQHGGREQWRRPTGLRVGPGPVIDWGGMGQDLQMPLNSKDEPIMGERDCDGSWHSAALAKFPGHFFFRGGGVLVHCSVVTEILGECFHRTEQAVWK